MAPEDLLLPRGFQMGLGWTVVCNSCRYQWNVPEGMREGLRPNAVQLLRTHYQEHRRQRREERKQADEAQPQSQRVEAYCSMCGDMRQVRVTEGKRWGSCTVCSGIVGTSY